MFPLKMLLYGQIVFITRDKQSEGVLWLSVLYRKVQMTRSVKDALLELSPEEWLLRRKGFRNSVNSIQVNETLLTIGNGYLNIRGSLEELPVGNAAACT